MAVILEGGTELLVLRVELVAILSASQQEMSSRKSSSSSSKPCSVVKTFLRISLHAVCNESTGSSDKHGYSFAWTDPIIFKLLLELLVIMSDSDVMDAVMDATVGSRSSHRSHKDDSLLCDDGEEENITNDQSYSLYHFQFERYESLNSKEFF